MLGLDPGARAAASSSTRLIPSSSPTAGIDAVVHLLRADGRRAAVPHRSRVANYFGVGAYLRPLDDVRRAAVRFASECLAFANVPDDQPATRRRAGVMRDVGADWDFADVRDHYLKCAPRDRARPSRLLGARTARHRRGDGRGLRRVAARRRRRAPAASCSGCAISCPAAGWGILDERGRPKVAWHHLRRALAPVAVWFVDEGLNGLACTWPTTRAKSVRRRCASRSTATRSCCVDEVERGARARSPLRDRAAVEAPPREVRRRLVRLSLRRSAAGSGRHEPGTSERPGCP